MNIMLTNIQSLTLDMQDIPVVAEPDLESFAGHFHQQFPQASLDGEQVFDFKEFLENLPAVPKASEAPSKAPPEAIWREYLTQDPIRIATDSDPLSTASVASTGNLTPPGKLFPELDANAPVASIVGEMLPRGKPLPDDALAQKPVPGLIESVAKPALSAAIAGDEIKPLAADAGKPLKAEPIPKPETQIISRQLDAVRPGQDIPVVVDPGTVAKKRISVDFIKLKDGAPTPKSDSVVARTNPLQTRSAGSIRTTGEIGMTRIPDIRAAVVTPQAQDSMASQVQPPVAAVVPTTRSGSEEATATTNKSVNQLTEVAFREMSPQREAIPEKVMRDITPPTETLPLRDVNNKVELRGVEVPVQTSTNSTQQTMPNLASTAQVVVAAPNNLAPNPQLMPLPPQLETLGLAQNSSSSEWASGLSERVNWMINQKQNTAIIRLDPPALGKLDVQLKIVDDATMITIQTQHAQTRDLIESASVRLRDFLQESGYQNVNVDVSHRQDQQQARSQMQADVNADLQDESGLEQAAEHEQREQISYFNGDGLVDTFA